MLHSVNEEGALQFRVDRRENRPALLGPEHGQEERRRVPCECQDPVAGLHAQPGEGRGDAVARPIELREAQRRAIMKREEALLAQLPGLGADGMHEGPRLSG